MSFQSCYRAVKNLLAQHRNIFCSCVTNCPNPCLQAFMPFLYYHVVNAISFLSVAACGFNISNKFYEIKLSALVRFLNFAPVKYT